MSFFRIQDPAFFLFSLDWRSDPITDFLVKGRIRIRVLPDPQPYSRTVRPQSSINGYTEISRTKGNPRTKWFYLQFISFLQLSVKHTDWHILKNFFSIFCLRQYFFNSLSLSVCLCISLSLSVGLSVYLCLTVWLSLSLSICITLSLSVFLFSL